LKIFSQLLSQHGNINTKDLKFYQTTFKKLLKNYYIVNDIANYFASNDTATTVDNT